MENSQSNHTSYYQSVTSNSNTISIFYEDLKPNKSDKIKSHEWKNDKHVSGKRSKKAYHSNVAFFHHKKKKAGEKENSHFLENDKIGNSYSQRDLKKKGNLPQQSGRGTADKSKEGLLIGSSPGGTNIEMNNKLGHHVRSSNGNSGPIQGVALNGGQGNPTKQAHNQGDHGKGDRRALHESSPNSNNSNNNKNCSSSHGEGVRLTKELLDDLNKRNQILSDESGEDKDNDNQNFLIYVKKRIEQKKEEEKREKRAERSARAGGKAGRKAGRKIRGRVSDRVSGKIAGGEPGGQWGGYLGAPENIPPGRPQSADQIKHPSGDPPMNEIIGQNDIEGNRCEDLEIPLNGCRDACGDGVAPRSGNYDDDTKGTSNGNRENSNQIETYKTIDDSSSLFSDESTKVYVNRKNHVEFNMCENPCDIWYGLRKKNGKRIFISSLGVNGKKNKNKGGNARSGNGRSTTGRSAHVWSPNRRSDIMRNSKKSGNGVGVGSSIGNGIVSGNLNGNVNGIVNSNSTNRKAKSKNVERYYISKKKGSDSSLAKLSRDKPKGKNGPKSNIRYVKYSAEWSSSYYSNVINSNDGNLSDNTIATMHIDGNCKYNEETNEYRSGKGNKHTYSSATYSGNSKKGHGKNEQNNISQFNKMGGGNNFIVSRNDHHQLAKKSSKKKSKKNIMTWSRRNNNYENKHKVHFAPVKGANKNIYYDNEPTKIRIRGGSLGYLSDGGGKGAAVTAPVTAVTTTSNSAANPGDGLDRGNHSDSANNEADEDVGRKSRHASTGGADSSMDSSADRVGVGGSFPRVDSAHVGDPTNSDTNPLKIHSLSMHSGMMKRKENVSRDASITPDYKSESPNGNIPSFPSCARIREDHNGNIAPSYEKNDFKSSCANNGGEFRAQVKPSVDNACGANQHKGAGVHGSYQNDKNGAKRMNTHKTHKIRNYSNRTYNVGSSPYHPSVSNKVPEEDYLAHASPSDGAALPTTRLETSEYYAKNKGKDYVGTPNCYYQHGGKNGASNYHSHANSHKPFDVIKEETFIVAEGRDEIIFPDFAYTGEQNRKYKNCYYNNAKFDLSYEIEEDIWKRKKKKWSSNNASSSGNNGNGIGGHGGNGGNGGNTGNSGHGGAPCGSKSAFKSARERVQSILARRRGVDF
ncbi:hypothetical protein C922_03377 [Plasmodium inui San Antonio 1]|uniref:Uncharacterized protein n=1 Tax=Plasmodium inui San Antonio 1 TaxID=1237626 RepID=W6ZZ66_9APIC|nr:hypothetical protein C922_03377 [Plasmodium inui San Antonio 1]EUD66182.1 hypothetical protein C922_03377 [Plasmodium inui San Antonio 1]